MLDTGIEFVFSDEQTYTLHPLTLRDWSAFSEWVGQREGKSLVAFDAMMQAAETMSGMLWLVHRSFRKAHPRVGMDQVMDLLGSLDRLAIIGARVMAQPDADPDPRRAEEAVT